MSRLLERSVPDDYLLRMASDWIRRHLPLGAWKNDMLVAVVRLEDLGEKEGWCGGLRVAPELRMQGLGRALMEYLMTVARLRGISVLRDLIEEDNTPSRMLAKAIGFRELLMASHLAGTITPARGAAPAVPVTILPEIGIDEMSWVRALGGHMSPTGPERFRFVRATRERLSKEMEGGTLFSTPQGTGLFLFSKPVKVGWSERTLRSFAPLNGPLVEIIDAAASLMEGDGSRVDGFLPVDLAALGVAEKRGWIPGEMWGRRVLLCERRLF
jgi:GNAT superfamily N-acetyltransferase